MRNYQDLFEHYAVRGASWASTSPSMTRTEIPARVMRVRWCSAFRMPSACTQRRAEHEFRFSEIERAHFGRV